METQEKICAKCGNHMIKGKIIVYASRGGGSLSWHSDDKIEQTYETLFTERKKTVTKKLTHSLMSGGWLGDRGEVEAWFCSTCKKVFAEFDTNW